MSVLKVGQYGDMLTVGTLIEYAVYLFLPHDTGDIDSLVPYLLGLVSLGVLIPMWLSKRKVICMRTKKNWERFIITLGISLVLYWFLQSNDMNYRFHFILKSILYGLCFALVISFVILKHREIKKTD